MTKTYRTVSRDAICVVAGLKPIDLIVKERNEIFLLKKGDIYGRERERSIKDESYVEWLSRWNESTAGRDTYKIFPDVLECCKCNWIRPDHKLTQVLTGHGNFCANIKEFNLVNDKRCNNCLVPETVEHVMFECTRFNAGRRQTERRVREIELNF